MFPCTRIFENSENEQTIIGKTSVKRQEASAYNPHTVSCTLGEFSDVKRCNSKVMPSLEEAKAWSNAVRKTFTPAMLRGRLDQLVDKVNRDLREQGLWNKDEPWLNIVWQPPPKSPL